MKLRTIKLTAIEAHQLATLMAATCRPRSRQEADAVEQWLRRLETGLR